MSERDEQRMKDLAERLVAMSPEPPGFPEEVTATRIERTRQSPILVFAGAALVVLLLAAIPLLLSRGGGEVPPAVSTTTTTPSTSIPPSTVTTVPEVTTTVPATTTTVSPTSTTIAMEAMGAFVFLIQTPENSFMGNPALVPFFAIVETAPDQPRELTNLQLLTNDGLTPPPGFETAIPDAVEVLGVSRSPSDPLVTVDMNQAFLSGAGGLLADMTMLNQLIFTAGDGEEISEVLFTVEGEPVTAFGSEGLDLSAPVGRDSFVDQLNPVNVDSAPIGSGDAPLVLTGFANVFEATVSLEVVDRSGNVVHEDFATASCGTGCWGAYSFSIDYPFEGGETIRVFWHSAEDGSPTDVVSLPVLWDDEDGWDLLGG